MRALQRNDDPPNDEQAFEVQINGYWFAWTEDDTVWLYTGDCSQRDDGYVYFGKITPSGGPESDAESELRAFVKEEYLRMLRDRKLDNHPGKGLK